MMTQLYQKIKARQRFFNNPWKWSRIWLISPPSRNCGIIEPFESKTGVDVEAACLVFPAPAPITITSLYRFQHEWQPNTMVLQRNMWEPLKYIAILYGFSIIGPIDSKDYSGMHTEPGLQSIPAQRPSPSPHYTGTTATWQYGFQHKNNAFRNYFACQPQIMPV